MVHQQGVVKTTERLGDQMFATDLLVSPDQRIVKIPEFIVFRCKCLVKGFDAILIDFLLEIPVFVGCNRAVFFGLTLIPGF